MKTKLLFVLFLMATSSFTLFGQSKTELDSIAKAGRKFANSIGIGAGTTTGYGFSYRYFGRKNGVQINFFPLIDNANKTATISAGLTLLHKLFVAKKTNLYLYLANSYLYNKSSSYYYNYNYINSYTEKWNTGLGVGFEWDTEKSLVLNIMAGYAQYNSFQTLTLAGEAAIYYRFE
jgi:hypothetical protein